jgi:hypothetical protein
MQLDRREGTSKQSRRTNRAEDRLHISGVQRGKQARGSSNQGSAYLLPKEGPGRETQGKGGRGCRGGRQAQKTNPKPGPSTMWQALCNRLQEQWISTYVVWGPFGHVGAHLGLNHARGHSCGSNRRLSSASGGFRSRAKAICPATLDFGPSSRKQGLRPPHCSQASFNESICRSCCSNPESSSFPLEQ